MAHEVDEFLAHYGVKGMRWGKRKDLKIERANSKLVKTKARNEADSDRSPATNQNIKIARANLKTANDTYRVRRAEANVVKRTEGKEAAKKLIREAKLERDVTYIKNNKMATMQTGEEMVMSIFSDMLAPRR